MFFNYKLTDFLFEDQQQLLGILRFFKMYIIIYLNKNKRKIICIWMSLWKLFRLFFYINIYKIIKQNKMVLIAFCMHDTLIYTLSFRIQVDFAITRHNTHSTLTPMLISLCAALIHAINWLEISFPQFTTRGCEAVVTYNGILGRGWEETNEHPTALKI